MAKLNAYGFNLHFLKLGHDYMLHRKQKTRLSNSYNAWLAVIFNVYSVILILQNYENGKKSHFIVSTSQKLSLNVTNFEIKK